MTKGGGAEVREEEDKGREERKEKIVKEGRKAVEE